METFVIYPNPTKKSIVNIKSSAGNLINIYNILEQEVLSTKINTSSNVQTLNLSGLQLGLYFCENK
ncbi:T9SS type A sorting domain-containing protein [Gaetbulibacter sp. M235]|uniref:T9SS type A sorting domain-containing protein n=1 Tax=Gaetbulibacter sp. M235 TaxID=3126510 RepID=UPI00374F3469